MNNLTYLLQVSACTAVFYLFYYFFLNRLTFFTTNRWYLLVTLVLSFTIPLIKIQISQPHIYTGVVQQVVKAYAPQVNTATQLAAVTAQVGVKSAPITWDVIVKLIYTAAVLGLSVHLLINLLAFYKRIRGKRIAKLGNINVLSGDKKIANGSFLNYIFLNDEELSADEIKQIIAHEMLHVRLYHSVDRIIFKVAQIVLWFNPFIYLYARSVEENHEFEVDRAMALDNDKHNYANLLVHLSVARNGTFYHNFSAVPLKKRIKMLFNQPSNNMRKIIYVLILPVVLISFLAFAQQQTKQTKKTTADPVKPVGNKKSTSGVDESKKSTIAKKQPMAVKQIAKPVEKEINTDYDSELYSRIEVKKEDGSSYDSVVVKSLRADGQYVGVMSSDVAHNAKIGFMINETLFSESAFRALSAETKVMLMTNREKGVATGDAIKNVLERKGYSTNRTDIKAYSAIFYFDVKGEELTRELKAVISHTVSTKSSSKAVDYNDTPEGMQQAKLRNAIMGKTITVTIKAIDQLIDPPSKLANQPTSGIVFDYNGNEYSILCWNKPEQELKKQLKTGDVITLKVVAAGSGNGMPVFVTPAYVEKDNARIYEAVATTTPIGSGSYRYTPPKNQ